MQASGISYQGMFPSIHRPPINQPSIKNTVENANGNLRNTDKKSNDVSSDFAYPSFRESPIGIDPFFEETIL